MSRFPAELFLWIIRNLVDDPKTLKQCSLVHRTWTSEAQKVLFGEHFVRIGVREDSQSFALDRQKAARSPRDFVSRVEKSSQLREYIRAIRINVSHIHHIFTSTHPFDQEWTLDYLFECVIAAGVSHIDSLALFSITTDRIYTSTVRFPQVDSLAPELRACLGSLTSLDLQTQVVFRNFSSLVRLLCSLPLLENFSCLQPLFSENLGYSIIDGKTSPALRNFQFIGERRGDVLLSWLSTTRTVRSLEHFTVQINSRDSQLDLFLRSVETSFTMDVLDIQCIEETLTCSNLEAVTLSVQRYDRRVYHESSIITHTLVQYCGRLQAPVLRSLRFVFYLGNFKTAGFKAHDRYGPSTLSTAGFPLLSSIHVDFGEGSRLQTIRGCRSFRNAFFDFDQLGVITFASHVVAVDDE